MEFLLDFILHIDQYMIDIVQEYHTWAYVILFIIIFCETGLVVTPFLPGDSLLFVAGAISALPDMPLEVNILALVLFLSAVLGDSCNYMIGHFLDVNFSIIPIPVYLGKVIWKRHMNFIKIRRKDNHYCPFCTYSPYICSFCSRYGQNALLLFYGV